MQNQIGALEVLQLKAHRRGTCNQEVNEWMMNRDNSIALLQEPCQHLGRILNIDTYIRTITGIDNVNGRI